MKRIILVLAVLISGISLLSVAGPDLSAQSNRRNCPAASCPAADSVRPCRQTCPQRPQICPQKERRSACPQVCPAATDSCRYYRDCKQVRRAGCPQKACQAACPQVCPAATDSCRYYRDCKQQVHRADCPKQRRPHCRRGCGR